MRLKTIDHSIRLVSKKFGNFFFEDKKSSVFFQSRKKYSNKFLYWKSNTVDFMRPFFFEKTKINVQFLEKTISDALPKEISYKGFIASHLQQEKVHHSCHARMKKKAALKRMLALVKTTILEMKRIEMEFISKSKG